MPELKKKVNLQARGEEAYVSIRQLLVSLQWRSAVDLDLMAFYRAKDGRTGGVFSPNYAGGALGSLSAFPFIELSGDAGMGAKGGLNEEALRIVRLDDMAEVFICAVNYTDAAAGRDSPFGAYQPSVTLVDDRGEGVEVSLSGTDPGTVAILARIDNQGTLGPRLVNESRVVSLQTFQAEVPGARGLHIGSKVVLKTKGEAFQLKAKRAGGMGELLVNLNWSAQSKPQGFLSKLFGGGPKPIDLDLGCLYELDPSSGQLPPGTRIGGAIQALGKSFGSFDQAPYILHCGDDRTGAWASGENLRINGEKYAAIRRVLIFAFIYEGVARWSEADAVVTIQQPGSPPVEVRLDTHQDGVPMCAIALLEKSGNGLNIKRLMEYHADHEVMDRAHRWGLQWVSGRKD